MPFFEDVSSFIFGGTDTSAQQAQQEINALTREDILRGTATARFDALRIFPEAQRQRGLGTQAALDVLGQSIPAQVQALQQGNVGAQQNLLAGLPQIQAAILGGQVDLSGLQPTQINAPLGFAQQQLPFQIAQPATQRIPELAPGFGGGIGPISPFGLSDQQKLSLLLGGGQGSGDFFGGQPGTGQPGGPLSFNPTSLPDIAMLMAQALGSPVQAKQLIDAHVAGLGAGGTAGISAGEAAGLGFTGEAEAAAGIGIL